MRAALSVIAVLLLSACATADDTAGPGETGGICGGIAGFQCGAEGKYCAMEPGVCKDVADAAGQCKAKPQACTMDYRPVCGCDGETYGNACAAAGAGVSVASEGVCD